MANLKIIWTTGSPFSPSCINKIAYETSPGRWNVYRDGSWCSQSAARDNGYRPATAEEIAEHWKVLYLKWTPEPGDKVIVTQDIGTWCNKKGTIVNADGSEYWIVKRDEDGRTCNFMRENQMILAPYEESVKPVEATETPKPISPESKHGFTIGDIVIPNSDKFKGKQCIVKVLTSCSIGVQCPSGVGLGHTLDGHCPDNTGWWYHPSSLELVSKEEPVDLTEIMPGVGSFKVGDKVVAHSKYFDGCTGTIVRIHPDGQPPLGVQFEKYHSEGHTLDGNCPMGYGWYYDKSDLTLVVEDKSLSKTSTPSVPLPKEGYITIRFLTEEEFKAKDLWDTYDDKEHPTGWNSNGKMNKYLGTYIQLSKSKFDGSSSFRYEDWHFASNNYEVIHDSVETKPETTSKPGYITVRFFTEIEFKAKGNWDTPATCPKGWVQAMNKYLGETVEIRKDNIKHDGELSYHGWTFLVDDYEVLTLGYESKSSPKVETKVETKVEPKKPEMKPQRFKVGDRVTYKSYLQCGGKYYYDGEDQKGFVGEINSYDYYVEEKGCYKIYVRTSTGGTYMMLESEFCEYDGSTPVKAKESKQPEKKFAVGDKVTYKLHSDLGRGYRFGGGDFGGKEATVLGYLDYDSEYKCYKITVTVPSSTFNFSMLECEFHEYDGTYPGAVTLGTSAGSDFRIISAGTANTTFLGTVGLQIHQTIPKPKDDLSHYNQLPVLIHKKPTKRLVVVDAY
jgi:hypothetical protein